MNMNSKNLKKLLLALVLFLLSFIIISSVFLSLKRAKTTGKNLIKTNSNYIKLVCMVLTHPKNHLQKALKVKKTWGKRCDFLLFMSSKKDDNIGTIVFDIVENRQNLWNKTQLSFRYVYENYFNKADWFLKADDDTYVIVENLKHMLTSHNSSDAIYFGRHFKPLVKQGYMSGGAGYVLSKEALQRFANANFCADINGVSEDVDVGECMQRVNVTPGDSRDENGKERFLPLNLVNAMFLEDDSWIWEYSYYKPKKGMTCCSDSLISIHYVSPFEMYQLEYLIYHIKVIKD